MEEHISTAVIDFVRVGHHIISVINSSNGASANSPSGTSANSQGPPRLVGVHVTTRPRRSAMRLYARRLTNDECLRAVEEGGVTGEDACPICLEEKMKQPVQLIHHDKRGGDGKANLCKTAMCFSCLQDCIKTQKPQQRGLIRPQCPCCRGPIFKAVTLTKPNVVLDIPNFHPLTYGDLLRDAMRLRLAFCFDRISSEIGGQVIVDWTIRAPVQRLSEASNPFSAQLNDWRTIYKNAGDNRYHARNKNFPTQREIMEAVKQKLNELNERSDLPSVYRLSLEDYVVEQKTKAELSTVVDLTDSPKRKKRKKAKKESAGCCGSCSSSSSSR